MRVGDVVGERFELLAVAGSGGMGEVFRALDRVTGAAVALKVVLGGGAHDARFDREARLLSELSHPGIVRYVAHGRTSRGRSYLAMEWLEGEDLSRRLLRGRLTVEETLTLGVKAAEALAEAHARDIVHRDLKPSNLFLVGGQIDQVKILDFGIARRLDATPMTLTGVALGTPAYMAPEQARVGYAALTPRADVFALGCVLFECLVGRPVFVGENIPAILAKILFGEVPAIRSLRPEVPAQLDAVVHLMLAKDPEERVGDGATAAVILGALRVAVASAGADVASAGAGVASALAGVASARAGVFERSEALTSSERRLLSVLLVGREATAATADTAPLDQTLEVTLGAHLRKVVEAHGGHMEALADGSAVVAIITGRDATDQASQAARCALALRKVAPTRPMALSTGRAQLARQLPMGEAIDRAARLLDACVARRAHERQPDPRGPPIAIDDVTARLLGARFEVSGEGELRELHGERDVAGSAGTLLGKESAFVGRNRELLMLTTLFAECVEASVARAVLVTAPAGFGKSRIAHELTRAARANDQHVEIWTACGDPLRVGSAFGLLGQAIRCACGIQDGEAAAARKQKLLARVARHVPGPERERVAVFLGEIAGVELAGEESALLCAAREDAETMGRQMRRAWEDFLAAETSAYPVLLVLEDLHWGDLPTVRFVDAALGALAEQPFMVLGLARPEVHDMFPALWGGRALHVIHLTRLPRKACERLVRHALGEDVDAETVARLAAHADGHAFYLEELIRAVAEGKGDALPETVLAMVQARLAALDGEARKVLRAASVFGDVFWRGGVAALLGSAVLWVSPHDVLSELVDGEVIVRRKESRFPGDEEFMFRHALLREGAYEMLTEADRVLGHRLAAAFLEERGASDPAMLAEHLERGLDLARAGSFYLRAAEQALRGSDPDAAIARARRGLECGAPDAVHLSLLGVLSEVHAWRSEWDHAFQYLDEAQRLMTPGSMPWVRTVPAKISADIHLGRHDELMATLRTLQAVELAPEGINAAAFALAAGSYYAAQMGEFRLAEALTRRAREVTEPVVERDPVARGWLQIALAFHEAWRDGDLWMGLCMAEAARESFVQAEYWRGSIVAQVAIGMIAGLLGDLPRAERELGETMTAGEELGPVSWLRTFLCIEVLIALGARGRARAEAARMLGVGIERRTPLQQGFARWALASLLRSEGDLEAAEREALTAIELLASFPLEQVGAKALLSSIQLAAGRAADALSTAREVASARERWSAPGYKSTLADLVHAEALHAAGERESASAVIAGARERLLARAEQLPAAHRRSFLDVPENAHVIELSRRWLRAAS
ncbi:protein kinase domain-containing protein [Sorangium sp. So ce1000]|uniref:protein kinase domain-containing protein n=1 Tax=Sorangium sp. So ce1000 TaxID=3133325 RepID=UPI003F621562